MEKKRKQRLIRFSLMNRKSKTGWAVGVQVLFRRTRALQTVIQAKGQNPRPKISIEFIKKSSLSHKTIAEKIVLGRRVYVHLADNPDFACINPPPSALLFVIEDLNEAHNCFIRDGSKLNGMILREKEKMFDEIFGDVLNFVDWIAKGDEEVYRSAGMVIRRNRN